MPITFDIAMIDGRLVSSRLGYEINFIDLDEVYDDNEAAMELFNDVITKYKNRPDFYRPLIERLAETIQESCAKVPDSIQAH